MPTLQEKRQAIWEPDDRLSMMGEVFDGMETALGVMAPWVRKFFVQSLRECDEQFAELRDRFESLKEEIHSQKASTSPLASSPDMQAGNRGPEASTSPLEDPNPQAPGQASVEGVAEEVLGQGSDPEVPEQGSVEGVGQEVRRQDSDPEVPEQPEGDQSLNNSAQNVRNQDEEGTPPVEEPNQEEEPKAPRELTYTVSAKGFVTIIKPANWTAAEADQRHPFGWADSRAGQQDHFGWAQSTAAQAALFGPPQSRGGQRAPFGWPDSRADQDRFG
jgi:hypothetical protein